MRVYSYKFEIEELAKYITLQVEKLSDKQAMNEGKTPDDFTILYRELRAFKKQHGYRENDPIDIIVLTEQSRHSADISELHNRLNYFMSESKEIATFFKGQKTNQSFHFPGGLSIWILSPDEYFYNMKYKTNAICVANLGVKGIPSSFFEKEDKKLHGNFQYFFMEPNHYWDLEKHITTNWKI